MIEDLKEMIQVIFEVFILIIIISLILFIIVYIGIKTEIIPNSKKECEEKGGIYVDEITYGSHCHFINERN